jgi:putative iron-dependent peroxidase
MTAQTWHRVPIEPQSVNAPLSRYAIFLVLTISDGGAAAPLRRH